MEDVDDRPALFGDELLFAVGQTEDAQLARAPVGTRGQNVGQQHRQAAVVVEPPDVDDALLVLALEQRQVVQHVLGQLTAVGVPFFAFYSQEEKGTGDRT